MQSNLLIKTLKKTVFFGGIASLVVIIDQLFKYKIRHSGGFYLCNSGISFGIQFSNVIFWLIIALFCLIILFYCVFLYKQRIFFYFSGLVLIGLSLFVGGVLSNLIDRLLMGCVLDYISFFKLFPIFNLADMGIFLGSCLVLFFLLSKNEPLS